VLSEHTADIPGALLYLVDRDGQGAVLEQACGFPAGHPFAPPHLRLSDESRWPLDAVLRSGEARAVHLGSDALVMAGERIETALVLPIMRHGETAPVGVLVAGVSPRLILDAAYSDFMGMVASQLGTAIASARALEEAKARADALAELDRAKTAFFSNVSHEFRTPLTLLLGPTEEAARSGGVLEGEDLQAVYRNAQRLLKLVNTLLDFSRIEAGRVQALFQPTDLSALTVDLASAFRSATERAGLELVVDCPPLPEPVYVDREMWEKVVLNLLSNAFKFTFHGRIQVTMSWHGSHVELTVADTGVGIPAEHLASIFDRFHRVEQSRGRTHEGAYSRGLRHWPGARARARRHARRHDRRAQREGSGDGLHRRGAVRNRAPATGTDWRAQRQFRWGDRCDGLRAGGTAVVASAGPSGAGRGDCRLAIRARRRRTRARGRRQRGYA
jgi:signal transduction histidine kinase